MEEEVLSVLESKRLYCHINVKTISIRYFNKLLFIIVTDAKNALMNELVAH